MSEPILTESQILAAASPGLVDAVNVYCAADPIRHKARLIQIAIDAGATDDAVAAVALEVADGLDALLDQIGAAVRGERGATP
jgi:hypothetical protein